ncbi:serine protease [Candidatus Halobeggiatoa sp. HSG11]|nr:serine protease [Candidatus Halobeggiatoa sp. HSG11]
MKLINYLSIILVLTVAQETFSNPQPFVNAESQQRSLRIIGGKDSNSGEWPWIVSVKYKGVDSDCGGSLIHPYWVLTAAHCVEGFPPDNKTPSCDIPPLTGNDVFVNVGLHKQSNLDKEGERLEVKQVIQHPLWNSCNRNWDYDLALLQLKKPSTQPLLNLANPDSSAMKVGKMAMAIGWGLTDSNDGYSTPNVLQQVELPLVSNRTCQNVYTDEAGNKEFIIRDNMLCAGYKEGKQDTCTGDSGGPLVVLEENRYVQVGIVSYGGHLSGPLCAGPDAYGVYTRVSSHLNFILKYVPLPIMAGVYDGAWTSPELPNTFIMLRNTVDTMAVVFLKDNGKSWQALLGPLTYPTITVTTLIASANMIFELKPTISASLPLQEIELTAIRCHPTNGECLLSEGDTIKINKIF